MYLGQAPHGDRTFYCKYQKHLYLLDAMRLLPPTSKSHHLYYILQLQHNKNRNARRRYKEAVNSKFAYVSCCRGGTIHTSSY